MAESLQFIDLFAGIGGFHRALAALGHECVFASELDPELREVYLQNFPEMKDRLHGDIRVAKALVPAHDILCAGFPCQPFSKSGTQAGLRDETRGTLFHELLEILRRLGDRKPRYVILENVGNFPRHDQGNTWRVVRSSLENLGYAVTGSEHITPPAANDWRDLGRQRPLRRDLPRGGRGPGLISPHHFGHPHHRERFFVVAALDGLPPDPFPARTQTKTTLSSIVDSRLTSADRAETQLTHGQIKCFDHWNLLIRAIPADIELPSFPIWGAELEARYPFERRTPWATPNKELVELLPTVPSVVHAPQTPKEVLLAELPSYAREAKPAFRAWKIHYIRRNREWWQQILPYLPRGWKTGLRAMPASFQKLEWNVKGGERDLWAHVLQLRPSGVRAKRYESSPALVAMTATQIPILGPERRFLTRTEGLRLQGFDDDHRLPASRTRAFAALGNAVHVDVVRRIARNLTLSSRRQAVLQTALQH